MTIKRGILYGTTLLLLGTVVYLSWPRSTVRGQSPDAPIASRRAVTSSGLGSVVRSGASARPRLAVTGTVRDAATSQGIGAVSLSFRTGDAVAQTVSSSDGGYKIEIPAGLYEISLVGAEHASSLPRPTVLIPQDEPVHGLDFWLQRIGTVAGRVIDERGKPLPNAQVTVQSARGAGTLEAPRSPARSDALGRFSMTVPPGEVVLRADATSLGTALSRPIYVRAGMHLTGVEIVVGAGGALSGRVLDPDGAGVAGAEVLIKDPIGLRRMPCDDQGRFGGSGLAPGTTLLQAVARGFAPGQVTELQIQPGPAHGTLTLQLARAKGVAGRVLSPEGAPVARARVSAAAGGPAGPLLQLATLPEALTDEAGTFQFADIPNLPLTLTARGPGNVMTSRSGVAPGSLNVVLQLESTGSIVGQVSEGQSGRPVTDFTVTLVGGPGRSAPALRVASSKGQFVIDELLPGRYGLTVTAPGYGPAEKTGLGVVAGLAARADTVLDGGGRISGLVVDSRGVGVPGASVSIDSGWFGPAVITDASGSFLIRDVARGRRSLSVTHPEFDTRLLGGVSVFAGETATSRVELSPREGSHAGLNLSGIGATLTERGGHMVVMEALPNSPAEIAGLRAGDLLVSVDEQAAGKLGFRETLEALRGMAGTPVRIRVQRGQETFELFIIRGEVKVPGRS